MYGRVLATLLSTCAMSLAALAFAGGEFPLPQGFSSAFQTIALRVRAVEL